jgi:hypothetical protein
MLTAAEHEALSGYATRMETMASEIIGGCPLAAADALAATGEDWGMTNDDNSPPQP